LTSSGAGTFGASAGAPDHRPGEVFEVGDLLTRLARLGITMTPGKVTGILDYWAGAPSSPSSSPESIAARTR
jgi:hypothetical protein